MDRAFIQARIDATKAAIVAYEDAQLALAAGAQSYTIDTGQTQQTVTKINSATLQKTIDGLYNRCAALEARLTGGHVITTVPTW